MKLYAATRLSVHELRIQEAWTHDQLFSSPEQAIEWFREDMKLNMETDAPVELTTEANGEEDIWSVRWDSPDCGQAGWYELCNIQEVVLPK